MAGLIKGKYFSHLARADRSFVIAALKLRALKTLML
jgi:hypothetical protein